MSKDGEIISLRTATLDIVRGMRGRPSAPWHSIFDVVSLAYLVRVSKKYEIDTSRLIECVHDAWLRGESSFDDVSIIRRKMVGEDGIYLITQGKKILAQLRLTSRLLEYLGRIDIADLQLENYPVIKQKRLEAEDLEIKDLNSETGRFNLEAMVTEKSTPRIIFSRLGKELLLSTVTIEDESGAIKLPLWNDQINMISVGDKVHIENARLKRFRGELQVRVGKFTKLQVVR
jgi:replication factor A1